MRKYLKLGRNLKSTNTEKLQHIQMYTVQQMPRFGPKDRRSWDSVKHILKQYRVEHGKKIEGCHNQGCRSK